MMKHLMLCTQYVKSIYSLFPNYETFSEMIQLITWNILLLNATYRSVKNLFKFRILNF